MLTSSYPSPSNEYSEGVFFREHAQAISLYCDVTVICSYSVSDKELRLTKLFETKDTFENGLRTIRFEFFRISDKFDAFISTLIIFVSALKMAITSKFDIMHVQKAFPLGLLAILLGKMFESCVVITEHSSNFNHALRSRLRKSVIEFAMKKADKVIAVSRNLSQSILLWFPNLDIEIIPNPVDINKFNLNRNKKKNRGIKNILHVSSLNHNKGINILIKAVKNLERRDFVIEIVGGNNERIRKFENVIKKCQLDNIFRFHGKKKHNEIREYMRNCDFFVLPSINESFGVVLIEAMACGKPVIATECGGPEEIVIPETGIIIAAGDDDLLKQALDHMLDGYRGFDSEFIANYSRDKFSYTRIGKAVCQVYLRCRDKYSLK